MLKLKILQSYGHYTASVRHPDKREVWRKADDSHVREIPEKQAKSEYAYLLFYQVSKSIYDWSKGPI